MKAIMVMFDSLNRGFLPPYSPQAAQWVKIPNFERLAQPTAAFDNSYVGSQPCMPARRELHTGRLNFLHRGCEIARGQEGDGWKASVAEPAIPDHLGQLWRQEAVNRTYLTSETQQPRPRCSTWGWSSWRRTTGRTIGFATGHPFIKKWIEIENEICYNPEGNSAYGLNICHKPDSYWGITYSTTKIERKNLIWLTKFKI